LESSGWRVIDRQEHRIYFYGILDYTKKEEKSE
jgi:hypothetical protein